MTQPRVDARADIKTVHDILREKGGDSLVKAELKGRWLEENPNSKAIDYYRTTTLNPEGQMAAIESLKGRFELSLRDVYSDESIVKNAADVDRYKLNLRDASDRLDRDLRGTHENLQERFSDEVLAGVGVGDELYKLGYNEISEFHELLDLAKAGAQRNATELAAELGAAMTSIDERDPRGNTELFKRLEALKTALKEWNELLASEAMPDKSTMERLADECGRQLGRCRQEHADTFATEKNPFVKFQLLATMRAIGEKVASQFLARAGAPSFTAMCSLIIDVPRSSSGTPPDKKYAKDLRTAFENGLKKLEADLRKVDKQMADQIRTTFVNTTPFRVGEALDAWCATYTDPGKLMANLGPMREAIAKIAVGLGTYRSLADGVLAKSSNAEVKQIRERYQQTFDGLTSKLKNDIDQCVDTLGR